MQMSQCQYLEFHSSILFLSNDASDAGLQHNDMMQSLLITLMQDERPTVPLHKYTAIAQCKSTHHLACNWTILSK